MPNISRYTIFFSLIFILVHHSCSAQQNASQTKQQAAAKYFVEAYNQQNYSKMKKNWFFIAKFLPMKKVLKREYEPRFIKLGKAKIGTMQFLPGGKVITEMIYEKDTTEKEYITMYFNNKNKITGLSINSPDFIYPKIATDVLATDEIPQNKNAKIDTLVRKKYAGDNFNGCVTAIDNGKVIYKKSYGLADFENKVVLNDSSVFELASCSKQFTALGIMILQEQGKLSYSDSIQKFLPGFPYKNISIENLLTHTSGLPDYMQLVDKYWDKKKFVTNNDLVDLFIKYKPKAYYFPNEVFDYSNTGYALLSNIIEKASGMSYAEFLDKNIFRPAGMKNSRVYNTRRSKKEKINNYAIGHVYSDKLKKFAVPDSLPEYQMVIYMDAITGDGTVNTTISDLALYDKALRENKLVSKTTLDKAYTKHQLNNGKESGYGYGVFISSTDKSEKVVWHSGGWPGYYTFILRFVDQPKTIAILSNNEYPDFMKMADRIGWILVGGR